MVRLKGVYNEHAMRHRDENNIFFIIIDGAPTYND